jgi:hypothetical protein
MSYGEVSWFVTFEMPEKTALLFQKEKDKKHFTILEKQANGNCIIRYRGLTEKEKQERKEWNKGSKHG